MKIFGKGFNSSFSIKFYIFKKKSVYMEFTPKALFSLSFCHYNSTKKLKKHISWQNRPYCVLRVWVKPTPLAANCSVKGCREQPLLFLVCRMWLLARFLTVADDYHIFSKVFCHYLFIYNIGTTTDSTTKYFEYELLLKKHFLTE